MKRNLFNTVLLALVTIFFFTGCAEPRYYHQHHHQHSPEYYHRHNQTPPSGVGVDLNIHN